jgi:hypothetical protein
MKRNKTPADEWERQEQNLRRLRRLLEQRVAEDQRLRSVRVKREEQAG